MPPWGKKDFTRDGLISAFPASLPGGYLYLDSGERVNTKFALVRFTIWDLQVQPANCHRQAWTDSIAALRAPWSERPRGFHGDTRPLLCCFIAGASLQNGEI